MPSALRDHRRVYPLPRRYRWVWFKMHISEVSKPSARSTVLDLFNQNGAALAHALREMLVECCLSTLAQSRRARFDHVARKLRHQRRWGSRARTKREHVNEREIAGFDKADGILKHGLRLGWEASNEVGAKGYVGPGRPQPVA